MLSNGCCSHDRWRQEICIDDSNWADVGHLFANARYERLREKATKEQCKMSAERSLEDGTRGNM